MILLEIFAGCLAIGFGIATGVLIAIKLYEILFKTKVL